MHFGEVLDRTPKARVSSQPEATPQETDPKKGASAEGAPYFVPSRFDLRFQRWRSACTDSWGVAPG